jgi:hypothetical protein
MVKGPGAIPGLFSTGILMARTLFVIGRIVAGVLVAALGTGATLVLLAELAGFIFGADSTFRSHPSVLESLESRSLPENVFAASVACLILALPCAILTAVVASATAILKGPAALTAMMTGGVLGCIAGLFTVALSRSPNPEFDAFVLCPATGALMGLVYWLIAVGPKKAIPDSTIAKPPAA